MTCVCLLGGVSAILLAGIHPDFIPFVKRYVLRNNIECLFILILFVSKLLSYLIQRLCVNRLLLAKTIHESSLIKTILSL